MLASTLDACISHVKGTPVKGGYAVSTTLDTGPYFFDTSIISDVRILFEVMRSGFIESRFWISCGSNCSKRRVVYLLVSKFLLEQ